MEFSVVGHERQKRLLSSLIGKDKLPHALLFAGPAGVGKRTTAIALLGHIFCEERRSCETCRPCRQLAGGMHPDLVMIKGEGSIKIDELRAVRKEVFEPPYEAPLRAIVVDNAELMTREAANALLKTLEEPPPSNLFILVTADEQAIPLTVRSRCMRIGFGPLPIDAVRSYFEHTLGFDTRKAATLSSISNGSIAAGLFWADDERFALRHKMAEFLTGSKKDFTSATLFAERIVKGGSEMAYLHFLLSLFRDVWWYGHGGERAGIVNQDVSDIIAMRAADIVMRTQGCIKKIQESMRVLRYNVNKWLALEHLFLNLVELS